MRLFYSIIQSTTYLLGVWRVKGKIIIYKSIVPVGRTLKSLGVHLTHKNTALIQKIQPCCCLFLLVRVNSLMCSTASYWSNGVSS